MPFYKQSINGAKDRWKRSLSDAMKRRAAAARCPQCGRKGTLKRVRVCHSADFRMEICP